MRLDHVDVKLGDRQVLKDFSLTLTPGTLTTLMGRSGCGKTTVLNVMLGIVKPDRGAAEGFGPVKKGVVFQEDRLIEHWDGWDNVLLTAAKGTTRAQVDEAFGAVLLDMERVPVRKLSGGQRRRVAVVRAVLAKPELLLLDEPFKGLDEASRDKTAAFIRAWGGSAATVLCTHDKEESDLLGQAHFVAL